MMKHEQMMMKSRELYNKMAWLNKQRMEDSLKEFKSSEVHCLEFIGKNADPNVTKLAKSFYMTTGAITKLTKKLIAKGVVESYRKPDNKKEIYFRLTPQGAEVFKIHETLHDEFQERDKAVFAHVTDEQYDGMLEFMERYSRHLDEEIKKLNLEIK